MGRPSTTVVGAPVEVGTALGLEPKAPDCGVFTDVKLQRNPQEVELAVLGEQLFQDMALTAEVAEAHLEVDASPAFKSELCEYGASANAGFVKSVKESVLFPANACPTQPSIRAMPVSARGEFLPQMAPAALAVEALVEVDVSSPGMEGEMDCNARLQHNVQEVELAVEMPLVSGDVQPSWEMAPTAEVTEAHVEVDASSAMRSELHEYGSRPDAELKSNVQKLEVAVNIQASFDPQEVPMQDGEEDVLICAVTARACPGKDKNIQFFASTGLTSQPVVTTQLVMGAPVELGVSSRLECGVADCSAFTDVELQRNAQEVELAVKMPFVSGEGGGLKCAR